MEKLSQRISLNCPPQLIPVLAEVVCVSLSFSCSLALESLLSDTLFLSFSRSLSLSLSLALAHSLTLARAPSCSHSRCHSLTLALSLISPSLISLSGEQLCISGFASYAGATRSRSACISFTAFAWVTPLPPPPDLSCTHILYRRANASEDAFGTRGPAGYRADKAAPTPTPIPSPRAAPSRK